MHIHSCCFVHLTYCLMCRKFHVVVVQCRLRNVQKSVMLMQSRGGVGIKFSVLKGALHAVSTASNKLDKHKKKQPP